MGMVKLSLQDLELKGKRVLVRVDFNVPLDAWGRVGDDRRIRSSLPTIRYILAAGGSVILMSHLGRPKGKAVPEMRLGPVAESLSELLGLPVKKMDDCVGEEVEKAASALKPGEVMLLENLRFHPEETSNDPDFARRLAILGDEYVNDAFGSSHRAHASVDALPRLFPRAAAGFLLKKELDYLGQVLRSPRRPFITVLGGAKVSDKIGMIKNLFEKVDAFLIGGGMAYTFLKAGGVGIGDSLVEEEMLPLASEILAKAELEKKDFVLPLDHVVAREISPGASSRIVPRAGIEAGWKGLDIGPATVEEFARRVRSARTVFWNGPLGVFEVKGFEQGTFGVARALADSGAEVIVGGGDSASALKQAGLESKVAHISTGGGASLEFLEGKTLPGVAALKDKNG